MNTPLSFLQSHFDALAPRRVEIEGFPFVLLYKPLTAEQTIKYVTAARAKTPREQAQLFAELLVESVTLESGKPAFPLERGQTPPVEVMTKHCEPGLFSKLVDALGVGTSKQEVEDAGKKSSKADGAGSSPSTSSPNGEAATSPP